MLGDPIFERAPIQSRLLRYLVERTVASPSPPTQYEIAVDGLGKSSEYDIENDSYPRVQISRLKRNLQNYYARNQPGNGLAICMTDGSYRLKLAPMERAPGEDAEHKAEHGESEKASEAKHRNQTRAIIFLIVAIGLLGLIALAWWLPAKEASEARGRIPKTALILDLDPTVGDRTVPASVGQSVEEIGKLQLRNSFVSRPSLPFGNSDDADYLVNVSYGSQRGTPALFLTLFSSEGDVLYASTISPADERTEELENKLEASLVYITSPNGVIARNELQGVEDTTSSDYNCFLSIENNRSRERTMGELIERCIQLYPESSYASFWHARRAFAQYQAIISRGETVAKSGPAWAEVTKALDLDPTNAFANFIAAKVELTHGRCENARAYIDRSLERGASYPTLVAAAEADGAACRVSPEEQAESISRLRSLARYTPDPDPLLHLYLMLGLLAVDDRTAAESLAERIAIENPVGPVDVTADLLSRSLLDPAFAERNEAEVRAGIELFVWSPPVTEKIFNQIAG